MKRIPDKKDSKRMERLERAKVLVEEELGPWLLRLIRSHKNWFYLNKQGNYLSDSATPDYVKKVLIGTYCREFENYFMDWYNIQQSHEETIKRIFRPLKYDFSIKAIQIAARVFLENYRSALSVFYPVYNFDWLSNEKITKMVNIATAVHIERWIEADRESKRNIKVFSEYRFGEKPSEKVKGNEDKTMASALYNAYEKYNILYNLRQNQARNEGTRPQTTPYFKGNQRALDLVALSWCDAWKDGYLQILDILCFRRHFHNRKSKRDSKQNEVLNRALNSYKQLMDSIDKCFWEGEKESEKYIEYVAKCVLVQKIERIYHFMFAANTAKYAQEKNLECYMFNNGVSAAYFGRYSEINGQLFDSLRRFNRDGTVKYFQSNDPLDPIPGEDVLLKIVNADELNAYFEMNKEMMRRQLLVDLLLILQAAFPVDKLHSWRVKDYVEAAVFYHEEYPMISILQSTYIPSLDSKEQDERENAHQYYDILHEFYLQLYDMDDSPLKETVEKNKTKRASDDE